MQGKEMKLQDGTAGIGEISREGYAELYRLGDKLKNEMRELYQADMVGTLLKLPDYLDMERHESAEEKREFQKLADFLEAGNHPFSTRDTILCITNDYGIAAEESGFRKGFRTAMRLCMEGMGGGVC